MADIDIAKSIDFHKQHGKPATMTVVQPSGRWGSLATDDDHVSTFLEKPMGDGASVNGGFFVISPKVLEYIENDETVWERSPLEQLAKEGDLHAFHHRGCWQPMDTLGDKKHLEVLWKDGAAPWVKW